jgi:predicted nucleotidyltransferase component of viral defense system
MTTNLQSLFDNYIQNALYEPIKKKKEMIKLNLITDKSTIEDIMENSNLMAKFKQIYGEKLSKEIDQEIGYSNYDLYHNKDNILDPEMLFFKYQKLENKWNILNDKFLKETNKNLEYNNFKHRRGRKRKVNELNI